ncbi:MAG: zinc-dependent metalloprotease, partial [Cyanobacteria bacterium J06636_16]
GLRMYVFGTTTCRRSPGISRNRNLLLIATLESGLGEAGLFRGWPINDLLVQFREMPGDRLQVVVPNTYIRNPEGQDWQQRLLDGSFSDSVIFAIDVVSVDPASQAKLIDLSDLVMESDVANLAQSLGWVISGYSRNPDLSSIGRLKNFEQNLELDATVGFIGSSSNGDPFAALFGPSLRGLADDRGFTLQVHYSISALPEQSSYRPRQADERVGYFLSVFRAPPQAGRTDPFVRHINRWHLEKQNLEAAVSSPREPIVFWIENTVPPEYRDAVRKGTLMWNEAFEQAGFANAVEVRQMPDDADWDPADVRYNVIRWSDSLSPWALGLGPSRVNPLTGEILDADIVIDANTVRWLQFTYQTSGLDLAPEAQAYLQMCGQRSQDWYLQWQAIQKFGEAGLAMAQNMPEELRMHSSNSLPDDHCAGYSAGQQTAFGALAISVLSGANFTTDQLDNYIQQYLAALTAHEVGHTLGLRHNFAGSRLLSPEELNDPNITRSQGLVSSVMDYFPPNIAPPGTEQGDFFPTRIGPYDVWAIEYGYRTTPPTPLQRSERRLLDEITNRSHAPELAYATDEDVFGFIDPETNAWDLSNNPLQFAQWQLENSQAVWQRLNRLSVSPGEGYGSLRRRVDLVFSYFNRNALTLANYVGGQRFRRLDPWDTHSQTPLEPVSAAKQREAIAALNKYVFAPNAFEFSPQLLNQLAPDRWNHWGTSLTLSLDYPIYEQVLAIQSMALSDLMLSERLSRVRDLEFKTDEEDVFTVAELFESLYQGVWSEVATPADDAPEVSSLRRGLQRHHLNILSNLVLRRTFWDALSAQSFTDFIALLSTVGAPEDARVLARYQLRQISQDVEATLSNYEGRMAVTTQAHLEDVRDRISRVLEAPLLGL